jgi:hypothetical protein
LSRVIVAIIVARVISQVGRPVESFSNIVGIDKAYAVIEEWMYKCSDVKRLEPSLTDFRYRIRYCLKTAENQERRPIRFETFREFYPDLYAKLGDLQI